MAALGHLGAKVCQKLLPLGGLRSLGRALLRHRLPVLHHGQTLGTLRGHVLHLRLAQHVLLGLALHILLALEER